MSEEHTERDTHFIGFAYRVLEAMMDGLPYIDVYDSDEKKKAVYAQFIAQCAYDLVKHTIDRTEHVNLDRLSTDEHIQQIPDLPALPKEENNDE